MFMNSVKILTFILLDESCSVGKGSTLSILTGLYNTTCEGTKTSAVAYVGGDSCSRKNTN